MHETHGCVPARKTWGAKGVCGPSLKAQHAHLSPMAVRPRMSPTVIKSSYKHAARLSAQSDQWFRYVLNWQTRAQSFVIRTAESNGAHAISVVSCTGSHITVVTHFHNNSLLACVETNRIKTSCFEAMSTRLVSSQ